MFTMVGDGLWDDIMPVVRLGGRAVHVVGNRWAVWSSLERALPSNRISVCRDLEEVPDALGSSVAAFDSACAPNPG
jgi:FMN phosphatase YigB (HAD superfamily)